MLNPYESPQSETPNKPFDYQQWFKVWLYSARSNLFVICGLLCMMLCQLITFAKQGDYEKFMLFSSMILGGGILLSGILSYLEMSHDDRS